jgi:hypothetical protein
MPDNFDPNTFGLPAEFVERAMLAAQREAKLQEYPAQVQAFVEITRLINDVRQATTLGEYRALQQRLGKHLARVEAAVGQANIRQSEAEKRLRRLKQRKTPATPLEIASFEAEREEAILDHDRSMRLARQYRTVGDAMAWQLYNFQTRVIVALGMNASPGIIGTKAGDAVEAAEAESYWREQRAFALRHDYTNCLRIWDLSVFYPDRPDGAELVEVKSPKGRVRSKQKNQGRRVTEFVKHKVTTTADGMLLIDRRQAPQLPDGPYQNNFPLIQQAVAEAAETGLGYAHNAYFAVKAFSVRHPALKPPDPVLLSRIEKLRGIPADITGHPCQDYLSAESYDKVLAPQFGAPYSIYLLPPNAVAALITGFLRLSFHLNTCAVSDAFTAIGFKAQFIPAAANPSHLGDLTTRGDQFVLERMGFTLRLSANALEQMLFEGLSLEDLVESIRTEYEAARRGNRVLVPSIVGPYPRTTHFLTTFIGLENMWRASRSIILSDDDLP